MKIIIITVVLFSLNLKAQIRLVKNINTFYQSGSYPKNFFSFNGKLYFTAMPSGTLANNPICYIYSTDGTTANTIILTNGTIQARINANTLIKKVVHNDDLVIAGIHVSSAGGQSHRLFQVNGSNNVVTVPVNFTGIYNPSGETFGYPLSFNDKIYFSSLNTNPLYPSTTEFIGVEPYVTDLTQTGTLNFKDIVPYFSSANKSSNPMDFTALGNNFFFSAKSANEGREIWKSDGTTAGTNLYFDINTGIDGSNPEKFNVLGNQLYFVANHPTYGTEIFYTDGTGSINLLKDINETGSSIPNNFVKIGSELYFTATNGIDGFELWKTDGTTSGTIMLKNINPTGNSAPYGFIQFNNEVYFSADDGVYGNDLWKTNGTNLGTVKVIDSSELGARNPEYLTIYNNKLYFTATDFSLGDSDLYFTDGTSGGTHIINVNPAGASNVSNLYAFNNELFMSASVGNTGNTYGIELYAFNDAVLSVNDVQLDESQINVYPNPTKNYFELSSIVNIENIEVYSLQGQLVKSFALQKLYNVSDLNKGIYIIKIIAKEGVVNKTLVID